MTMFEIDFDITPAHDLMVEIRTKVAAIGDLVREEVKGPIADAVRQDVDERLVPYPGPVEHPFIFASDRSRAFYFAAMRNGLFDEQTWDEAGGEWQRTGTLAGGWVVDLDPRTTRVNTILSISNVAEDSKGDEYAKAVYGPDPVPGHANTGWDEQISGAVDVIADRVTSDLVDALARAITAYGS